LAGVDRGSLHSTDATRLAGLPGEVLQPTAAGGREGGLEGWKLSLKMPCDLPVMQSATDRELRREMYRPYSTIAADQGDQELDNSQLIEQLLKLRSQEASLLGYGSFAQLRLQTRMAESAEQVVDFLRELAGKAKPYARRDLAQLQDFAHSTLGLDELQPWDMA